MLRYFTDILQNKRTKDDEVDEMSVLHLVYTWYEIPSEI